MTSPTGIPSRPGAAGVLLPYLPLGLVVVLAVVLGVLAGTGSGGANPIPPAVSGGGVLGDVALGVAAVAAVGLAGVPATARRRRAARRLMADVDAMSGVEFEARLAVAFAGLGYRVETTAASGDFGADLLIERDGALTVVQAKRYEGAVGIGAVQEVIGARHYYAADRAMVVTNSRYTPPALSLAEADEVSVVGRGDLAGLLAASAARRGGDGRWLFMHQVVTGLVLCAAALLGLARLGWRAAGLLRLVRSGRKGRAV